MCAAAAGAAGSASLSCDAIARSRPQCGVGGGSFTSGAASNAVKSTVDLDVVAGGKISLSTSDAENLIVRLQVDGYLAESVVSTACAYTSSAG